MMDLRTEIITFFTSLESLATDWDRLWSLSLRREIFGTFAWARAWWRAYGSAYSLRVLAIREGNRLVGLLPLVSQGRTLQFLGTFHNDYNDLLCAPHNKSSVLEAALQGTMGLLSPGDRCELESLPEDSSIVTQYRQLAAPDHRRLHLSHAAFCPRIVFSPESDSLLQSLLHKKSLRRHENSLRRLGELRFRHLEDREEIKHHLPALFHQHMVRRERAGDTSIFTDQRARSFYVFLVEELDPRTVLRFAVLELDGRPIAYHFGFEMNNVFLWYKPTFDPQFFEFSPGEVLIKRLLEYVGSRGVRIFDFTVGNEAFKTRFANAVNCNYNLYLFPSGVRGQVQHCYNHLKDYLKQYPRLFLAIRSAATMPERLWANVAGGRRESSDLTDADQYRISQ